MEIDWTYECDAPRYRDFQEPSSGTVNSSWFDSHEEYPGAVQSATSLQQNDVLADVGNTGPVETVGEKPAKKKNIVTSWGASDAVKHPKVEGGASKKRATAAVETENRDPTEQLQQHAGPARAAKKRTKRSKAAATEAAHEAQQATVRPLKAIKIITKKKSSQSLAAKLSRGVLPARSVKITIPEDIELATDKRAAAHAKVQVVHQQGDENDDDTEHDGSPYKPLVLRVREFDKTPGRFKRQPDEPLPAKSLGLTKPKEPQLQTSVRVRPSTFKPREEQEAEEMAHMPVFRASTLNPLILSTSGPLGLPRVDKRAPTEARPFNFVTDDRAEARAARMQKLEEDRERQHEPQRKKRLRFDRETVSDGEGGGPAARQSKANARKSMAVGTADASVPRSPLLHTKFRARQSKAEEQRFEFHARPLPKFLSVPSLEVPKERVLTTTKPEPFKLATEERGAQHRSLLECKLSEEEKAAKRARIPRAHGLPMSTDMPMVPPKPEARKLTVPEPFQLASETLHAKYEEERRRALEAEEAEKREAAAFKAKPVWRGVPFRPLDVDVPLTVPEPVVLNTSSRVAKREEFNRLMEEKIKQDEARAKEAEEELRRREEEERRQLRKQAVFRAMPMPDLSAPPAAKPPPPPKQLTKPVSPALGRRSKRRRGKKQSAAVDADA